MLELVSLGQKSRSGPLENEPRGSDGKNPSNQVPGCDKAPEAH